VRNVPIHPAILPMLRAMKERAGGKGLVCPDIYAREASARALRTWLLNAGVERLALYKRTSVSSPIRWHDLRSTFASWHAVAGTSAIEIRDVMGHTSTSMTDKYLRNAQAVRGGSFGQPFPELPEFNRHRRDIVGLVAEKAKHSQYLTSGYIQPSPVG
jgi:integrase